MALRSPCVPFLPVPGSMAGMSDLAYWLASGIFCFTLSFLTTLMLYGFAFLFSVATYAALPLFPLYIGLISCASQEHRVSLSAR